MNQFRVTSHELRVAVWLLALVAANGAWGKGAGTSGLGELDLPVSALAAATGDASAGLVDDATAVTSNPARLGAAARNGVAATHTVWPIGFSDSLMALYGTLPRFGSVGGQLRVLRASFDEFRENPAPPFAVDAGSFAYQTVQAAVAFAPDLSLVNDYLPVKVRVGAGLFLVRRSIADERRNGAGGIVGATAEVKRGFEVYAIARNLGRMGRTMPMSTSLGLSGGRAGLWGEADRLRGAVETFWSREAGIGGAVGIEYALQWAALEAAVRAGYRYGTEEFASLLPTAGLAFRIKHLSLEVGVAPMGDLGVAQILSVSYQERRQPD